MVKCQTFENLCILDSKYFGFDCLDTLFGTNQVITVSPSAGKNLFPLNFPQKSGISPVLGENNNNFLKYNIYSKYIFDASHKKYRKAEYVQRRVRFVNVQSSLHENVVFSVCASVCNAAYVIFIR